MSSLAPFWCSVTERINFWFGSVLEIRTVKDQIELLLRGDVLEVVEGSAFEDGDDVGSGVVEVEGLFSFVEVVD